MFKSSITRRLFFFLLLIGVMPVLISAALILHTFDSIPIDQIIESSTTLGAEEAARLTDLDLQARRMVMIITFIVIICVAALSVGVGRSVVLPLQKLISATESMAQGKLDVRIRTTLTDEIGTLAEGFNHMARELSRALSEVEEQRQNLEYRVAERTAELNLLNAAVSYTHLTLPTN